jgi:peptidoglycan/xylan/chitin deacetylase (PgdA/CDA1 family)
MNLTTTKLFAKRGLKTIASIARAGGALGNAEKGAVNILAYHRVAADISKAEVEAYYGLVVSTATFRRHCELLAASYNVVPLAETFDYLNGSKISDKPLAAITFDDGYLDFYEEAFPVLRELGLPATVFLPTECIEQSEILDHDRLFWLVKQCFERSVSVPDAVSAAGLDESDNRRLARFRDRQQLVEALVYLPHEERSRVISVLERRLGKFASYPRGYRLLNWVQIREMAHDQVDFGGHTANHVVLPLEEEPRLSVEITSSKADIERQTGRETVSFAYPNGEYNSRIRKLVAEAGFRIAVTTERRKNRIGADPLSLGRISLCEESTRGLSGSYSQRVAAMRLYA